jgi:glycerol-3-phosphate cytidylyltransferase
MNVITWITADPIHNGHIRILRKARDIAGDGNVIVCISTNEDIQVRKSRDERFNWADRVADVRAISYVDIIDMQDPSFTKKNAIEKYKPDVILVGDDYDKDWDGAKLGLPVIYVPRTPNISSTDIHLQNF